MVSARRLPNRKQVVVDLFDKGSSQSTDQHPPISWALQDECNTYKQFDEELKEFIAAFIELVPHAVAVVTLEDCDILLQNQQLASLEDKHAGVKVDNLLSDLFTVLTQSSHLQNALQHGESLSNYRFHHQRENNEPIDFLVSATIVKYQGQLAVLLILEAAIEPLPSFNDDVQSKESTSHLFAQAAHYAGDAIEITDAHARLKYVNPAFELITGYTHAEVIGKTPAELFRGDQHEPSFYQALWDTISSGHVWSGRLIGKHKDGSLLHQNATVLPIHNEAGSITHFIAVKRNVSQCKYVEDEWQKFAALVEHSNDFIAMSSLEGKVLYVNDAGRTLVGLDSLADAQAKSIAAYLPNDELTHFCEITLPTLQTAGYHSSEGQLRHFKTGERIHVHRSCFAVKHMETGETMCLATIQRDITAQKQAEAALKQSEERFRTIAEALPEAMVISRVSDGTVLYANPQVRHTFGLTAEEMIGRKTIDFYANATDRKALLALLAQNGYLQNYEVQAKKADGTHFWVSISLQSLTFNEEKALVCIFHDITSRKQTEEQLRLMERAIAASRNGVVLTDATQPNNPIIYVNSAFEKMTGYTADEILGKNCRFLQGDDHNQSALEELRMALQEHRDCHITLRNYHKDGTLFWNELYVAPVLDAKGQLTHFVGIQSDITKRKEAEEALRQQEEQYRHIVETATEGIWVLDENSQTKFVNQQMAAMLGYSTGEMVGKPLFAFMDDAGIAIANAYLERRREGITEMHDFKFCRKDGTDLWAIVSTNPLFDSQGNYIGALGMVTDITDRKRMEEQLAHDAFHDALTGLPNRLLFMERLQQAIAQASHCPDEQFAVLFLDLDRFKVINDSLGHLIGDQLLVAIASRLSHCLRPSDTIARLGGDEFIILLNSIEDVQNATHVANCIQQSLKLPFNLSGHEVFTTASIGIVLHTSGCIQPDELLRNADTALYYAKEQGKACHAVFDTAMHHRVVALLQVETDLRWAIERQELRVFYQPIVCLKTGTIAGFEALVRWQHPERGLISPAEFIAVAEETRLIIPMGQWVLREACQQLHRWQKQFPHASSLTMSVNLSSHQFSQPDLAEHINQILQETKLKPSSLKLEITESGIIQNEKSAAVLLQQLKALQVELSIDDFGTGYSSLSRLRQFPIDTLKIDRAFVSSMHESENAEIVQAIVTLSHNLGMDVVAEGVETAEQMAQLKQLKCQYGQGYFFSKPLNNNAAEMLLSTRMVW